MKALSRRSLLQGGAGLGLSAGLYRSARAADAIPLDITTRILEVRGKPAKVFGLVGPDGRPGLSFGPGEDFRVDLSNHSGTESLIHWHGLTPPSDQDGVP